METHFWCIRTSLPELEIGQFTDCGVHRGRDVRRLKLLTGVDTSTLPVNKSGKAGNKHVSSKRSTNAVPNTRIFRRSIAMRELEVRFVDFCPFTADALRLRTDHIRCGNEKKSYREIFPLLIAFSVNFAPWRELRRRVCAAAEITVTVANCLLGTSGSAKNYITRTQAVRKLQISLPDFRRLCIFKGNEPSTACFN